MEEILYSAMEDFALDIVMGKGTGASSIRIDLAHFTLIGATTRAGSLSAPLRDRFLITNHMQFYEPEELKKSLPGLPAFWALTSRTAALKKSPAGAGVRPVSPTAS